MGWEASQNYAQLRRLPGGAWPGLSICWRGRYYIWRVAFGLAVRTSRTFSPTPMAISRRHFLRHTAALAATAAGRVVAAQGVVCQ
ncbi:MAG: twin-arginine translocation signal domain-containing protein [Hymenobacter sp.]|nr:MAG: twin-arginine translocation signal domain-containing protein [Hymenobacter sp.]